MWKKSHERHNENERKTIRKMKWKMKKNCHSETITENRGSNGPIEQARERERDGGKVRRRESSHSHCANLKNLRKHSERDRDREVFKSQYREIKCFMCLALALQVKKTHNTMCKI